MHAFSSSAALAVALCSALSASHAAVASFPPPSAQPEVPKQGIGMKGSGTAPRYASWGSGGGSSSSTSRPPTSVADFQDNIVSAHNFIFRHRGSNPFPQYVVEVMLGGQSEYRRR